MKNAITYEAHAHITGVTKQHLYVGTLLKDERIEITFLRLPLEPMVLPYDGYREELARRVFSYLRERHTQEPISQRLLFDRFLDCSNGVYGTHQVMHPCNLEIGCVQLCKSNALEQDVEVTQG